MVLPLYLAMTAAEIRANRELPLKLGYMACHFSPYSTGLSNCPERLPERAMLILNDRTPIHGHDPVQITCELKELISRFHCESILLDFQRPGEAETAALANEIICSLPCPIGISQHYAHGMDCAVFLPPVPLDALIEDYLKPWQGREIWLDISPEGQVITLREDGASAAPLPHWDYPEDGFRDDRLHCHYRIETDESARFTLFRSGQDLDDLLKEAHGLGVTQAVGLYQELGNMPFLSPSQ